MSDYVLSCESALDLTAEHTARRSISCFPFSFELDGRTYRDDLWQTMSSAEFYRAMADGAKTRTSQINASEYADYFSQFLGAGKDVLHLCLSSGITGTVNSARLAAEELREGYPERKLYVVDSLAMSGGFGLLMDALADRRDGGMELEELVRWTEENKLRVHHWFFSTDLTCYIRGGRISRAAGTFGGVLGICPLLNVSADGRLAPREKIRSKKNVIRALAEKMVLYAENGTDYQQKCYLRHSACEEDARQVAELVEAWFPKLDGGVQIAGIGPTIGSHTGPGTVALFFWGVPGQTEKERDMSAVIMTDTNSGISPKKGESLGLKGIPMPVLIDEKVYHEGVDLTAQTFYQCLRDGRKHAPPGEVLSCWDELFAEGFDEVLYIPMSGGLSSSFQMVRALAEDYGERVQAAKHRSVSVPP